MRVKVRRRNLRREEFGKQLEVKAAVALKEVTSRSVESAF